MTAGKEKGAPLAERAPQSNHRNGLDSKSRANNPLSLPDRVLIWDKVIFTDWINDYYPEFFIENGVAVIGWFRSMPFDDEPVPVSLDEVQSAYEGLYVLSECGTFIEPLWSCLLDLDTRIPLMRSGDCPIMREFAEVLDKVRKADLAIAEALSLIHGGRAKP